MLYFVLINIFVILAAVIIAIVVKAAFKSNKVPMVQSNIYATVSGIPSIRHDNSSKKVSESIAGAKNTLKKENIDNFSIDEFYDLMNDCE